MAFAWSKDIETGNTQIDNEHKQLVNKINDLLTACSSGKGRMEIVNTMKFLQEYTNIHFAHEEKLQKDSNYPDYIQHKRYHQHFVRTVNDISKRLEKEGATIQLVGEINQEIGTWLFSHIKAEDTKLAKHLLASK